MHLIKEHPSHFEVHDGKGPLRIAKRALSAKVQDKIRSLQHFDEGGEVNKDAGQGGSGGAGSQPQPDPAEHAKSIAQKVSEWLGVSKGGGSGAVNQNERKQLNQLDAKGYADGGDVAADDRSVAYANLPSSPFAPDGTPIADYEQALPPPTTAPGTFGQAIGNSLSGVAAGLGVDPNTFEMPKAPPTYLQRPPDEVVAAAGAPGQSAAPAGQPPQAAPAPVQPGQGAAPGYIAADERRLENAVQQKAKTDAMTADLVAQQREQTAKQLQDLTQKHQEVLQQRQDQADQMFKDLQTQKIDPNHFWAERSTGQKIGAAISIMLGGLGAGLARTTNQATTILNDRINQDIQAQKDNVNQKNNVFAHYLGQTKDIMAAQQLTRADLLEVSAAQLQAAASKYGSKQVTDGATMEVAKLRQAANLERQQAQARSLDIEAKTMQVQQMRDAQVVRQQLANPQGQQSTEDQERLIQRGIATGVIDPKTVVHERVPLVNKSGQQVMDQNGMPLSRVATRMALDEDAAKKAREALSTNDEQQVKLSKLRGFVAQHPIGTWNAGDNQTAKSLTDDFLLSWNKSQEGLPRLSQTELDLVKEMTGNPGGWWSSLSGKTESGLKTLAGAVQTRRQAVKDSYLR